MNTDAEYLTWWERVKSQFVSKDGTKTLTVSAARAAWIESEKQTRVTLTPWLNHHPTCQKIVARRANLNWSKIENTCTCGLDTVMGVKP